MYAGVSYHNAAVGVNTMGGLRMAASSILLICLSLTVCDLKHSQFKRVEDVLIFPSPAQAGNVLKRMLVI